MSKNVTQVRKAQVRKQITKELTALKKIEAALVKAKVTIEQNSPSLTGDNFNQIAQVFTQLNVAVTVTDSAMQDRAHKFAQTFVK